MKSIVDSFMLLAILQSIAMLAPSERFEIFLWIIVGILLYFADSFVAKIAHRRLIRNWGKENNIKGKSTKE